MPLLLSNVKQFWERQACGEMYSPGSRYQLEPYIPEFAHFDEAHGKDVLEIGVGMGEDHESLANANPRSLTGIDLTRRAIDFTSQRGLPSGLSVASAEELPFPDNSFDRVYSWGVLHHTPNTEKAVAEVYRVLRPGGIARIMIYSRWSITMAMLWLVYGLPRLWSIDKTIAHFLESPGTRVFSKRQAKTLFAQFHIRSMSTQLGAGDLLLGVAGQRHEGAMLRLARRIWPRRLIMRFCQSFGLGLLIEAQK